MEIDSIVVHVGFNDIMKGCSEWLKLDFKELIDSLLDINKRPIISVSMPSLNRGIECFSTIISLHNWLRDCCSSMGVTFVDNFDTFWKQNTFIRRPKSTQIVKSSWILSQHNNNNNNNICHLADAFIQSDLHQKDVLRQ
jgi:hypothetical protein